jgi:hypothetical protein
MAKGVGLTQDMKIWVGGIAVAIWVLMAVCLIVYNVGMIVVEIVRIVTGVNWVYRFNEKGSDVES